MLKHNRGRRYVPNRPSVRHWRLHIFIMSGKHGNWPSLNPISIRKSLEVTLNIELAVVGAYNQGPVLITVRPPRSHADGVLVLRFTYIPSNMKPDNLRSPTLYQTRAIVFGRVGTYQIPSPTRLFTHLNKSRILLKAWALIVHRLTVSPLHYLR